jgi:hypothetical protein
MRHLAHARTHIATTVVSLEKKTKLRTRPTLFVRNKYFGGHGRGEKSLQIGDFGEGRAGADE